jgi:hypothetical protein
MEDVEVFLDTQEIDVLLVAETHFAERNCVHTYAANHPKLSSHQPRAGFLLG